MIPIRLEMKNFLPYRAPDPVYFEGVHLACLTGANGAGKSSLLDAITWALWGKARARRDDDLIHLGQSEMYIQLDFEQEGNNYRVIRRRKAGKRGHGALDLFVIQPDGNPRTINEPSMRQTQRRIDEILRLDYETFVNSAFLQQGKADAFTTKTPAERKKILSDILGLDQWSVYEERTKEHLKVLGEQLAGIRHTIGEIDRELANEPRYQQEQQAAAVAHKQAEQALQEAEQQLTEVQDAPANLRHAQAQHAQTKQAQNTLQQDLDQVCEQIDRREALIAAHEAVIAQAEAIEAGYATLKEAEETDKTLNTRLRQVSDLNERINTAERDLTALRNDLEREQAAFESSIRETERTIQADSTDEQQQVQARISELETLERERETLQTDLVTLKEERSGLLTRRDVLTTEGSEMNERMAALEAAEGATCPLCGQTLSDDHRERLLGDLITQRDTHRQEFRTTTERLAAIADEAGHSQTRINTIGDTLAELPALRSRAGALEQQATAIAAAQIRLSEAQEGLQALLTVLDGDDYGHEIRRQLDDLYAQRTEIGYDRTTHETVQTTLSDYSDFADQHQRLRNAREHLPLERDALTAYVDNRTRLQAAIDEKQAEEQALSTEIEQLKHLVLEYNRRQQAMLAQRTAFTQAAERLAVAKQQLVALARNRERKADLQEDLRNIEAEQALYQELRQAFGKNGVPAMIIEAAIPELEVTANELLTRMTDGRMHLRFSTQRAKASGSGVIETLDIDIADELGTRPYEMYSGGEAFRINFAIRVALSKMLARRAGAHLRTLFIDEGFGTQDADGRSKLVEAITAIQSEFDLMLVITHIDELRDAFPVHIVIDKTAQGSMVRIQ